MDSSTLKNLLETLQSGQTGIDEALQALKDLPFADLGYANVDHHRALRQGVPEVIFALGKTSDQLIGIAREIVSRGTNVLMTRIEPSKAECVVREFAGARHSPAGRTVSLEVRPPPPLGSGYVALVTAGTSDLPVAEECAESLRALGIRCESAYDIGVAGIHRLLARRTWLTGASVAIVIAGMEGALPSVVGGLVDCPVIAVPTSVGYGVSVGGFTALFGMLTSCASGVTVCNIDNGFGAAFAAARMLRPRANVEAP